MLSRQQKIFFQARQNITVSFAGLTAKERKTYLNGAQKLASDAHNLGLIQAVSFLISRGEKPQKLLVRDLALSMGFADRADTDHLEALTAAEVWLDHLIECSSLEYADAKRRMLEGVLVAYIRLSQVRVKEETHAS